MKINQVKSGYVEQAEFLRTIAKLVEIFDNQEAEHISMSWLVHNLQEAANEAEQEAEELKSNNERN